jgi:outer membrane protein assembly factor BamE (lipoprotein component of BamABCDE complex)
MYFIQVRISLSIKRKVKMKKLIIAFGFVLLAGCATVGKDFSESDVASIQKGVTTEQTVLSTFGKPATVTADSEGNKIYTWTYAHATAFSVGQGKALVVKINKDGIVDSYVVSKTQP